MAVMFQGWLAACLPLVAEGFINCLRLDEVAHVRFNEQMSGAGMNSVDNAGPLLGKARTIYRKIAVL